MSSNLPHSYLTTRDCVMLNRVLADAGFKGIEAEVIPGRTGHAARFLIDLFQTGIDSEGDLVKALGKHAAGMRAGTPGPVSVAGADRRLILNHLPGQ